jgi:hypothetical protein
VLPQSTEFEKTAYAKDYSHLAFAKRANARLLSPALIILS